MSFRDNLQHLRATRNMTQEQLAMLLGVSRQSVTKWEAEKATPELDKLLKMCQIFECSLDDLVQGDLTSRPIDRAAAVSVPAGPPADVCGYDEHMRHFAWQIPAGIAAIILGVAACTLVGEGSNLLGLTPGSEWMSVALLFLGILIGVGLLVVAGMDHAAFTKAHPYIEDFYTAEDKAAARRYFAICLILGIGFIFLGVVTSTALDDIAENETGFSMLCCIALGVAAIVHGSIMLGRTNIAERNREAIDELEDEDIAAADMPQQIREEYLAAKHGSRGRKQKAIGAVCGTIMLIATIIALCWLFLEMPADGPDATVDWGAWGKQAYFWLPWPIGGICCGIASILIEAFWKE